MYFERPIVPVSRDRSQRRVVVFSLNMKLLTLTLTDCRRLARHVGVLKILENSTRIKYLYFYMILIYFVTFWWISKHMIQVPFYILHKLYYAGKPWNHCHQYFNITNSVYGLIISRLVFSKN